VYLGNSFPLEVSITADLLKGKTAHLKIWNQSKLVGERTLDIKNDQQFFNEKFVFEATEEGTQRFIIQLSKFENELNSVNNQTQALIDVLDNRDKILIIAAAPHPDIAALRSVLSTKESLEIDVTYIDKLEQNLEAYNLIIAHGFESGKHDVIWNKVWEAKIPLWVILYGKSDLSKMSRLNPGFKSTIKSRKVNRISPLLNKDFNAFVFSPETQNFLRNVPPLHTPFGEILGFDASQTLLFQKLGSVETDYPLALFNHRNEVKTAWLLGEGIWQWKLVDYQQSQTTKHFEEVIWKTVQYLAVKEDKSRFRVKLAKKFYENQSVKVQAEFYNKSYELVNELEVKLVLTDQNDEQFKYVFNATSKSYSLSIGQLTPGAYSYTARVKDGLEVLSKSGRFIVAPVNVEWSKSSADFNVLKRLSLKTGGEFFLKEELKQLKAVFADESAFPSISYTSEKKQSLFHEKWIFFLILVLLSVEWFMRKYKGRY
jgi:7,8-dihydro-6-hydroxymethylpterin-pyrophosphokinase